VTVWPEGGAGTEAALVYFRIDHDPIEGGHLIVASGEIDLSATPRLSTVLAIAQASPGGRLVLDLSEVAFIDSTALGTILKAAAQLDESGTNLAVVVPKGPVRRLLEVTNLTQRFKLFATRSAALAADGAPA
jgi:anti-sigma B factor antagonist